MDILNMDSDEETPLQTKRHRVFFVRSVTMYNNYNNSNITLMLNLNNNYFIFYDFLIKF